MTNTDHAHILAERAMLDRLLERWQVGQIGAWDVVAEAETMEQAFLDQRERSITSDGILVLRDFEHQDPRSISAVIVDLLTSASWSYILPEDIAIMRMFLQTPVGEEEVAWEQFDAYWQAIDYEARKPQVDAVYFPKQM